MLISDTSHFYMDEFVADPIQHHDTLSIYWGESGKWIKKDYGYRGYHITTWQIGYEVLKFIPDGWGNHDNQIYHHWEHETYLCADKNPLNKNIIVWQSKQIQ